MFHKNKNHLFFSNGKCFLTAIQIINAFQKKTHFRLGLPNVFDKGRNYGGLHPEVCAPAYL